MQSTETIVSEASALEPLTLSEAREQVRIYTSELDSQLHAAIAEVRELCEIRTARTLRTTVTRMVSWPSWPKMPIKLPWPPLIAVGSLKYYDTGNVLQTVDAANYRVFLSAELQGRLEPISTWSAPALYDRADAVQVEFTAGYQTREAVPPCVKRAAKILLSLEFDDVPPNREDNARRRAMDCLTAISWGPYR